MLSNLFIFFNKNYYMFSCGILLMDSFSKVIFCFILFFYFIIGYYYFSTKKLYSSAFFLLFFFIIFLLFVFFSSFDLFLLVFIFESLSLTLYFLMLLSKFKNYNSIEVVIKYFFIGAFSTFSLLFSVSFIYGHFGTTSFFFIKKLITLNFLNQLLMPSLLLISICILLLSFFLKLGIFPFNFWVADIYEGMSYPILLFYNTVIKVSLFSILIKITHYLFIGLFPINYLLYLGCIGSLVYGGLAAINQLNIKRFIAFTAINNLGWLLIGLCCGSVEGLTGTLIYLFVYTIINFVFFFLLLNIEFLNRSLIFFSDLTDLYKVDSFFSFSLLVVIFSMAGFPPFGGFFAKYCLIFAAVNSNLYSLVFLAMIIGCISGFYYLKLIKSIFFTSVIIFKKFNFFFFNNIYIIFYVVLFIFVYFLLILGFFLSSFYTNFLILSYYCLTPLF